MASQWHQRKGFAELARHEVVRSNIFHLMKIYGIRPSMSAFDVERLGFGWGFNLDAFKLWLEDLYVEDIKGKRRDLDFQVITLKVKASEETVIDLENIFARYSSGEATLEEMVLGMIELVERNQFYQPQKDYRRLLRTLENALNQSEICVGKLRTQFINIVQENLPTDTQKKFIERTGWDPDSPRFLNGKKCLRIVLNFRLPAKVADQNTAIFEGDHQLPSSVCKTKSNVGNMLPQPFSFSGDSRPWNPTAGAGKWLVSLPPRKLDASRFPWRESLCIFGIA
jgi:hypothetical protein